MQQEIDEDWVLYEKQYKEWKVREKNYMQYNDNNNKPNIHLNSIFKLEKKQKHFQISVGSKNWLWIHIKWKRNRDEFYVEEKEIEKQECNALNVHMQFVDNISKIL